MGLKGENKSLRVCVLVCPQLVRQASGAWSEQAQAWKGSLGQDWTSKFNPNNCYRDFKKSVSQISTCSGRSGVTSIIKVGQQGKSKSKFTYSFFHPLKQIFFETLLGIPRKFLMVPGSSHFKSCFTFPKERHRPPSSLERLPALSGAAEP